MAVKPTPRQIEAFRLRVQGMAYSIIGEMMGISKEAACLHAAKCARAYKTYPDPQHPDRLLAERHFKPWRSRPRARHLQPGETIP